MADLIGQRLGNYRLLRLIGRGGFADVYLAEHIHLGTEAAIKVLQVRLVESNRENFLNEARTIAHLVHPYIIRVLDFGVEDEIPFLVMDYAPRGTFRQRYLQGRPLPAAPLVSFMKQAAAALQYGHDKKLIHRDVKPENMLLGPNDEVLLSDFGFALIAHNSTSKSPTETAGTAAYMAPEQLQGKPRPASDQYALGVIAYEWLSGSCPFHGSFFEIASQQVFTPPPSLREKVPNIAPEIVKVVMTALEKDPQLRFPAVRDFALALENACLASKQYGFQLPVAQQSSSIQSNTSGVAFSTINQRSRDSIPLPSGTRYSLTNEGKDEQKRLTIDLSQQAGTPVSLSSRNFNSSSHSATYTFPVEMQSPTRNPQLNLPPLQETYAPLPKVPQSNPQSEIALSGTPSTRAQTSAPAIQPLTPRVSVSPASSSDRNLQMQNTKQNTISVADIPLHLRPPRSKSNRPGEILLIGLFILLILGASAGAYSYVTHNVNNKTTRTASPKEQAKGKAAQSASLIVSPTAVPDTMNPYPPHSGTFVMNEPLTGNNYGWQESTATPIGGACKFVEGGYQDSNPIIDPNPCFANNTNFANFTYQVDMKFTAIGQLHSGGGIVFRGNSTTNKYYFFEVYNSGKYSLQICNAGDCTLQLAGYKSDNQILTAFHPGLNVVNTLAIVATGPRLDLYVNSQLIKEVVDTNNTYDAGMLGVLATGGNNNDLRTAATSTPAQVLFSNAKVWKL
ncbi:MAG: serine/threonine protein kinase [Ktedonobacteraceae bacterium]|nr:serine/threonine protein kinase [Ktedonobacteraceae bacterium]